MIHHLFEFVVLLLVFRPKKSGWCPSIPQVKVDQHWLDERRVAVATGLALIGEQELPIPVLRPKRFAETVIHSGFIKSGI